MSNGTEASKKFLGIGISMNVATDAQGRVMRLEMSLDANGRIQLSSYDDHVHQSILLIIQTAQGERVMRPDFGAGLLKFAFEPLGAATASLVQREVTDAVTRFEPRIDILHVDVTTNSPQSGALTIELGYRVRRTDTIYNMVFPFFLDRGGR
jgi:phage baseplate assembly protein W